MSNSFTNDPINFERLVFAEAARRTLSGPVTPGKFLLVAGVYAGLAGIRYWARATDSVPKQSSKSTETSDNFEEPQEEPLCKQLGRLLASATNSVELGAIHVSLGIPLVDGQDGDALRARVESWVLDISDAVSKTGNVEQAEAMLRFAVKQVRETLRTVRDV